MNPQMSAPTSGIPNMPALSVEVMDQRRSFQVAALSPVQCAAYAPEPGKDDLRPEQVFRFQGLRNRVLNLESRAQHPPLSQGRTNCASHP